MWAYSGDGIWHMYAKYVGLFFNCTLFICCTGKHYNRALRVHRTVLEALERLLLQSFESSMGSLPEEVQQCIRWLAENPSDIELQAVVSNEAFQVWFQQYLEFRQSARDGKSGMTAQWWMMYIDKSWAINGLYKSVKTNDMKLRLQCLDGKINQLFFSQNHQNYARYVTYHTYHMLNLEFSHPGAMAAIEDKGFSVNRSKTSSSRNAVDLTIEQTDNKDGKGKGGCVGFTLNAAAVQRWAVTRPVRAEYKAGLYNMVNLIKTNRKIHKDCEKSEISKSEADVRSVINSFENHFLNPFTVDIPDKLFCVSSGVPVSDEIAKDLLSIDKIGEAAYREFIQTRLVDKTTSFHDPIKRIKTKTFVDSAVTTVIKSKKGGKDITIKASRNVFIQLTILASDHNYSLEKMLEYPLSPIPWSLATADGMTTSTDKAQLMHFLEKDCIVTPGMLSRTKCSTRVIDGMALLRQQKSIPKTFREFAEQLFDQLYLQKYDRVDFITDTYGKEDSIKELERIKRGISNQYLVGGPSTTVPREYQQFLTNPKNKEQLISLLLSEWKTDKYARKLHNKVVFFVQAVEVYSLSSSDGKTTTLRNVERLYSSHEEADPRIILHSIDAADQEQGPILVSSPDTDVFILLIHFFEDIGSSVYFETGTGDKKRIIDVGKVYTKIGRETAKALPGIHATTGSDTTSAFVRKGKIKPMQLMMKDAEVMAAYAEMGEWDDLPPNIASIIEGHICKLYGAKDDTTDINGVRYKKFIESYSPKNALIDCNTGKDVSLLPPCHSELMQHFKRANYQCRIWRQANKQYPSLQNPIFHGFRKDNEILVPHWNDGDVVPMDLLDLVQDSAPDDLEEVIPENSFLDIIYSDDHDI